jgi:hypothetical protein
MLDINALSKNYGLTNDQTETVKASFQAMSAAEREKFGQADFEALLASKGITGLPGGGNLPNLPSPSKGDIGLDFFSAFTGGAVPSLGGAIMALITQNAAEQRQSNKELKAAESDAVIQSINDQAAEMKKKALIQLILGVTAGAISIAGGLVTAGKGASSMTAGLSADQATLTSTKLGAEQAAWQGASTIASTLSTYYGTMSDAKIKKMEATEEHLRQNVEVLKDLNEALTELIRKTMAAAEAIQDGSNQALSKILA